MLYFPFLSQIHFFFYFYCLVLFTSFLLLSFPHRFFLKLQFNQVFVSWLLLFIFISSSVLFVSLKFTLFSSLTFIFRYVVVSFSLFSYHALPESFLNGIVSFPLYMFSKSLVFPFLSHFIWFCAFLTSPSLRFLFLLFLSPFFQSFSFTFHSFSYVPLCLSFLLISVSFSVTPVFLISVVFSYVSLLYLFFVTSTFYSIDSVSPSHYHFFPLFLFFFLSLFNFSVNRILCLDRRKSFIHFTHFPVYNLVFPFRCHIRSVLFLVFFSLCQYDFTFFVTAD